MDSILAIDPGPVQSAWIRMSGGIIRQYGLVENFLLLHQISDFPRGHVGDVGIEMIASYGMPVGAEVFETCVWIGRFYERIKSAIYLTKEHIHLVKRQEVKLHLCKSPKANDASIRQALIDRYGPGKEKAIGNKANPGPLYGLKADLWAALAVAVTLLDANKPDGYRSQAND